MVQMLRKAMFIMIAASSAAAGAAVVRDIPYAPENGKFGLGDLFLPEAGNGEQVNIRGQAPQNPWKMVLSWGPQDTGSLTLILLA